MKVASEPQLLSLPLPEMVLANIVTKIGVRDVLSYEPIEGTAEVICQVRRKWRKPGSGVVSIRTTMANLYPTFEQGLAAWRSERQARKAAA